jgi:hypothetical protein
MTPSGSYALLAAPFPKSATRLVQGSHDGKDSVQPLLRIDVDHREPRPAELHQRCGSDELAVDVKVS